MKARSKEAKDERVAPRRGRPRAYDENRALTRATDAFWRSGFSATSLDDLSEATAMNRPSLYGAFGDKRSLYRKTLERYVEDGRQAMREALDPSRPLREGLMRVYEGSLALYFPRGRAARGCFLIGTAVTEAVTDPGVRDILRDGLLAFDREFEARLGAAQAAGEIDSKADLETLARIASAILHTLALRSRAGDSVESLRATARAGVDLLCGPLPGTPSR
jgi:AcrR family transcriptional regulator